MTSSLVSVVPIVDGDVLIIANGNICGNNASNKANNTTVYALNLAHPLCVVRHIFLNLDISLTPPTAVWESLFLRPTNMSQKI